MAGTIDKRGLDGLVREEVPKNGFVSHPGSGICRLPAHLLDSLPDVLPARRFSVHLLTHAIDLR
jgi:hypothetical protein